MDSSSDVGLRLADVGLWLVELVLAIATGLTGPEAAPGLVSLGLLLALVVCILWHGYSARRFNRAVRSARSILRAENGEKITCERVIDIDRKFGEIEKQTGPEHRLAIAWSEFRETTVLPERDAVPLRNTVRPAAFFAREELGLDHGIWRYVPALFVSVGLLLTFLGLVAALDQTGRILDSASQEAPVLDADEQRLDQTGRILDDAPVRNEVDATTEGLKTLLLRMQESLRAIQTDTTAGAQAIREASDAMVGVAAGLSRTIQESVNAAAEASGREIEAAGHAMASVIGS